MVLIWFDNDLPTFNHKWKNTRRLGYTLREMRVMPSCTPPYSAHNDEGVEILSADDLWRKRVINSELCLCADKIKTRAASLVVDLCGNRIEYWLMVVD